MIRGAGGVTSTGNISVAGGQLTLGAPGVTSTVGGSGVTVAPGATMNVHSPLTFNAPLTGNITLGNHPGGGTAPSIIFTPQSGQSCPSYMASCSTQTTAATPASSPTTVVIAAVEEKFPILIVIIIAAVVISGMAVIKMVACKGAGETNCGTPSPVQSDSSCSREYSMRAPCSLKVRCGRRSHKRCTADGKTEVDQGTYRGKQGVVP